MKLLFRALLQKHIAKYTTILLFTFLLFFSARHEARADDKDRKTLPGTTASFALDADNLSFTDNVKSPAEFEAWRNKVLSFYRKTIRIRPDYEAIPLDVLYTESKPIVENVIRHRIEYSTTDNLRVPAYLFVPKKAAGPVPAIIVYSGHGPGKINAAEGDGTNENALARYLAEKLGYVVLAPDSRSFGEFIIEKTPQHFDYFYSLIFKNKLYMSKLIEDGYQDIALLRSLPQVDMNRVGAAGISMGSWRALNTTVLQNDIKAVDVSGLYIPWDYLFSEHHCRCQHIPALAKKIRMEDLAATIFPRDLMVQWGKDDGFFKMGAEKMIDSTKKIADTLGYSDHFFTDIHEGMGHRFSNPEIADFFFKRFGEGAWPPKKL